MSNIPAGMPAIKYDEYVSKSTQPWNDYLITRICQEATNIKRTSKTILDVGTGTARTLIEMAKCNEFKNCNLIGIDFFDDMVVHAKSIIKLNKLENDIKVLKGDVHHLEFLDNTIDIVFGRSVIHHWDNPIRAYQEIYRVLAPGGICLIHEPSRKPSKDALNCFNKLRKESGVAEMSLSEKFTRQEVLEQIQKAGLGEVAHVEPGVGLSALGFELRIVK